MTRTVASHRFMLTAAFVAGALVAAAAGCSGGGLQPDEITADAGALDAGPDSAIPTIDVSDVRIESADVAVLYPLEAGTDITHLIPATEPAAFGPLLAEMIGPGSLASLDEGAGFSTLRLVGIRLDPCSAHFGCNSEARLIFQPISSVGDEGPMAGDGAAHAFYDVPPAELTLMLRQILTLKKLYGADVSYGDELSVHPLLVAGGVDGPFARGLREIVKQHLGWARLTRVTISTHDNFYGDTWGFAIFDRRVGGFEQSLVANTDVTEQRVDGSSARTDELGQATFSTSSISSLEKIALIVGPRPVEATTAMREGFAAATDSLDIEVHSPANTDCVTCHLAEGARNIGINEFGFSAAVTAPTARSIDYRRETRAITNMHAFGYLGRSVSIMQRTAIEAAHSADQFTAERFETWSGAPIVSQ
jgi:hypothetical protein